MIDWDSMQFIHGKVRETKYRAVNDGVTAIINHSNVIDGFSVRVYEHHNDGLLTMPVAMDRIPDLISAMRIAEERLNG